MSWPIALLANAKRGWVRGQSPILSIGGAVRLIGRPFEMRRAGGQDRTKSRRGRRYGIAQRETIPRHRPAWRAGPPRRNTVMAFARGGDNGTWPRLAPTDTSRP